MAQPRQKRTAKSSHVTEWANVGDHDTLRTRTPFNFANIPGSTSNSLPSAESNAAAAAAVERLAAQRRMRIKNMSNISFDADIAAELDESTVNPMHND